jgi:hypothetical protein
VAVLKQNLSFHNYPSSYHSFVSFCVELLIIYRGTAGKHAIFLLLAKGRLIKMKRYYFFGFPWELIAIMGLFAVLLLAIVWIAARRTSSISEGGRK